MQAINALIQVAGIPLLLKFWGINYYGEWLLLFTIPSYIALSDMGLGSSTTSELSMLVQAKRHAEAMSILRNTFWFILIMGGIPFVLLALSVFVLPWYDWLGLSAIPYDEFVPAFFFLIVYIYLALFLTLPLGYYRVGQIYHRERYISSFFRVLEFLLIVTAVVEGFKIVLVAFIYLLVRTVQLLFVLYDLSKRFDSFRLFPFGIEYGKIKHLLKPGLSAMSIYMGQNLVVQGLVMIIGIGLGSAQVVLFSTTRTLVNMVKQIVGIINLSITSEFSYAYGARNYDLLRKIFKLAGKGNAVMSAFLLTGLYFFGAWIVNIWTGGKVKIIEPFFLFILIGTFVNTLWNLHLVLLVATNKLVHTGLWFLLGAALLVIINAVWIHAYDIHGVAFTIICFELVMLFVMIAASKQVIKTQDNHTILTT